MARNLGSNVSAHARRWGPWLILFCWGMMLGSLLWREFFSPRMELPLLDAVAAEIQEREEWLGIYAYGKKVGFANSKITREGKGFLIEEQATIRMRLLGMLREVRTTMDLRTDQAFLLKAFRMHLSSGPVSYEMLGEVKGDALQVEVRSAGRNRKRTIPMKQVPWLAQNLRYLLFKKPLEEGRKFQVPLFDPLTSTMQPLKVFVEERESWSIAGKDVPVYRLLYSWNGLQSYAWVSDSGETLREEGWGHFSMVRETREEALTKGWPSGGVIDLMQTTAIPVKTKISSPRRLRYMKIRFSNVDLTRFTLHDHRQTPHGSVVEVRQEDLTQATTFVLPHVRSPDLEETLAATPFIQSDDPQINELGAEVVGSNRDALRATRLILKWVHENLVKVPTVSVPSAVEILRTRQGDCNEHAVLFASLSRAVGIPTKICAGLLYQDGRFYYHAWNEVYLGEWFSIDSLLGQFPADATHVKFVEGDLSRQTDLIPLIGKLQAEILSHR